MELLFVCLAAHDSEFRRWPDGVDRRICQTFAASPGEPGELTLGFRPELKILLAGTPERTVRNAAELCEVGPTLKSPYNHKLVLDRIKRLLPARAEQGGR